jgi:hypothetical protein
MEEFSRFVFLYVETVTTISGLYNQQMRFYTLVNSLGQRLLSPTNLDN